MGIKEDLLLEENAGLRATVEKGQAKIAEKAAAAPKHPAGWEPGFNILGKTGSLVTRPTEEPTIPDDWDDVLKVWGLDPAKFEIVEPVNFRAWDTNVGDRCNQNPLLLQGLCNQQERLWNRRRLL